MSCFAQNLCFFIIDTTLDLVSLELFVWFRVCRLCQAVLLKLGSLDGARGQQFYKMFTIYHKFGLIKRQRNRATNRKN